MVDVNLSAVQKSYGQVEVIPPLDLNIQSGEFIALVGPSGSGKSTLLRVIAGLESIDAGTITVSGTDVTDFDPGERDMAMVFQTYALYPHMSVAENMGFALKMRKVDEAEIKKRVNDALRMLALEDYADRRPGQLSGGQRQRVAMGRAIVRQPRVFLFDEPLSNLDAKLRAKTRLELRELHNKLSATSVFVTHDQIEAMTMADRIVLLDHGTIQQIATPREIYQNPKNKFVASFIGSPEINILPGELQIKDETVLFGGMPLAASSRRLSLVTGKDGVEMELGVRPEHFQISKSAKPGWGTIQIAAVEFTGQDAFISGDTELGRVTIRLDLREDMGLIDDLSAGTTLYVAPMQDCWHLFDTDTGSCLTSV